MEKPYRQNAAVIITDGQGRVLLCERNDPTYPMVQTVQGGVQPEETHRAAAIREVCEEVGLRPEQFIITAELAEKYRYDFLPFHDHRQSNKYRGQEQTFFLAHVHPDVQFNLTGHEDQEFRRGWWGSPREFVEKAWELKRPGIEMALRGFGLLTD